MSYLKTKDGLKIYYNHIKSDNKLPTLVFIHGWLVNWSCFKDEIRYFRKKGYPILYLDLRGHGKSSKPNGEKFYSIETMAEDVKQILAREKVRKVIPVGYSMGGMVALMFNIRYPSLVHKTVLVDTSYRNHLFFSPVGFFKRHKTFVKKLSSFLLKLIGKHDVSKQINIDYSKMKNVNDLRIFLKSVSSLPYTVSLAVLNNIFDYDVKDSLSNIKNDVLVITSKDDQFFDRSVGKKFSKKLKKAKVISMRGTHSVIVKKSSLISKVMDDFLTS